MVLSALYCPVVEAGKAIWHLSMPQWDNHSLEGGAAQAKGKDWGDGRSLMVVPSAEISHYLPELSPIAQPPEPTLCRKTKIAWPP